MDKRIVILAYRRGLISLRECAQVLGVDLKRMSWLLVAAQWMKPTRSSKRKSAKGS